MNYHKIWNGKVRSSILCLILYRSTLSSWVISWNVMCGVFSFTQSFSVCSVIDCLWLIDWLSQHCTTCDLLRDLELQIPAVRSRNLHSQIPLHFFEDELQRSRNKSLPSILTQDLQSDISRMFTHPKCLLQQSLQHRLEESGDAGICTNIKQKCEKKVTRSVSIHSSISLLLFKDADLS